MGFNKVFFMLFGGFIGYLIGNVRGQKYRHVVGFFTGWIARHQGEGIPVHYAEVYHPITDITFTLSQAEQELLKDPYERSHRCLPPLEKDDLEEGKRGGSDEPPNDGNPGAAGGAGEPTHKAGGTKQDS